MKCFGSIFKALTRATMKRIASISAKLTVYLARVIHLRPFAVASSFFPVDALSAPLGAANALPVTY